MAQYSSPLILIQEKKLRKILVAWSLVSVSATTYVYMYVTVSQTEEDALHENLDLRAFTNTCIYLVHIWNFGANSIHNDFFIQAHRPI